MFTSDIILQQTKTKDLLKRDSIMTKNEIVTEYYKYTKWVRNDCYKRMCIIILFVP